MSKFKKKKGGDLPAISTASLPDIVFMLLFFFMVFLFTWGVQAEPRYLAAETGHLTAKRTKFRTCVFHQGLEIHRGVGQGSGFDLFGSG